MKKLILSLLALSLLVLVGCVPADSPKNNDVLALEGNTLSSSLQREASPDVSQTDQKRLASGNNEFALDLYQTLKEEKDNLVYSPLSISLPRSWLPSISSGYPAFQPGAG